MTDLNKTLDANIPREVIETRSQGGKNLSYLPSWYVIDRLNQVLGTENWSHEIVNIIPLQSDKPSYAFHVRIKAQINGMIVTKDGIGYGSDKGTYNAGEMALKEAESDALKRAAMKLGRSLGLALYDKSQEFVSETQTATKEETKPAAVVDDRALRSQIKSIFKILSSQKKIDSAAFSAKYLNGGKVDVLLHQDVVNALNNIRTDYPEFA